MKQTSSAGGIVVRDGLVVLVRQGDRTWSFPKGHVEKGESFLVAAKREIYEETGLKKLEVVREFVPYKRIGSDHGKKAMKEMHIFLFRASEEALRPLDRDITEARWVEKDKVTKVLTNSKDRKFFLGIKDGV